MPSLFAHSIAGLCVHAISARDSRDLSSRSRAALLVGLANAADVDLLLKRIVEGCPHQGPTHSLAAAVLAGAVVTAMAGAFRAPGAGRLGLAALLAWLSHLGLDWLSADTSLPIGLQVLWPFSEAWYKTPVPLFLDTWRSFEPRAIAHNAVAGAWELALLAPLLVTCWRQAAGRSPDGTHSRNRHKPR